VNDLGRYAILVVDDEIILRDVIVFDLKKKGFSVFSADNGEAAFEILKLNQIHLVISDIRMPGGGGIVLIDKIRSAFSDPPAVIFITGYSEASERECLAKGAWCVIQKPFQRKAFMQSVFDALGAEAVQAA
jgi:CheY-like chemotaxis protein